MNENSGKFYNQAATTTYFNDIKNSIDEFYNMSLNHMESQTDIVGAIQYQGLSAESTKKLIASVESPLLREILLVQQDLLTLQSDIQKKFADEVDSASDANLEYDVIEQIENDFRDLFTQFEDSCVNVEALSERCQKYKKYYNFTGVDFTSGREAFENFCGKEDGEGYLSEVKTKLVNFDSEVKEMIAERKLDERISTLQSSLVCSTYYVESPQYMSSPNSQQVLLCSTNSKSKKSAYGQYEGLMNQYGFAEEEIDYLKENYPGLLMSLDGARRYSTSDANRIYDVINEKLEKSGVKYFVVAHELVDQYELTDEQKEYIKNLESMVGYKYTYYDKKGNDQSKVLTSERVASMEVVAAALFEYGENIEFVAAVLGNIVFEGGAGHIESSKYSSNEPGYLSAIEYYFEHGEINKEKHADLIKGGVFDRNYADKMIYRIENKDKFVDSLGYYIENSREDNICGFGMCQWTTKDRLGYLLSLYKEGDYSYSDIVKAEATMIVKELSGEFDTGFDKVDEHCEKQNGNLSSEQKVKKNAELFYAEFERGRTDTGKNRADVAYELYKAMKGE